MAEKSKQEWVPLESNPDVLNKYIHNLGTPADVEFVDVFGLDTELLAMVPGKVRAVVMLFPITDKSKAKPIGEMTDGSTALYFVKQTISNACGTIAIVHALANNIENLDIPADSQIATFVKNTKEKTPTERAACLEADENMGVAHSDSAQEGQTKPPPADEKVNTHFVTFVGLGGKLYELNGSCDGPIYHRETHEDTLLQDAAQVVKEFMERDPDEVNFTVMALCRKE